MTDQDVRGTEQKNRKPDLNTVYTINDDGSRSWAFPDVSGGWVYACEVYDQPYTVELSVGGKYVYGYNLRMKNVDMLFIPGCEGYEKTGYYRLTFYAPEDVVFDDNLAPNVAPPFVPADQAMVSSLTQ